MANISSFGALVAGAALMIGGCSGGDDGGATTGSTSSTSATSEATDPSGTTDSTTSDTSTSTSTSTSSSTSMTTDDPSTSTSAETTTSTTTSDTTSGTTSDVGVCGDGVVDAGEECDDGNEIDGDACTNNCTIAACGDGAVQEGAEGCDDGNEVDGDACTNACELAACGDGIVQEGVEGCDDGNSNEADECTSLCAAPSCEDGIQSGAESDVDCGGPMCSKCAVDAKCGGNSDCAEGLCLQASCQIADTCKVIKQAAPASASGKYTIDAGTGTKYEVFCDMVTDGGGWTILYATNGGDNIQGITGSTEVLTGDPLMYQPYNRTRALKVLLSGLGAEGLIRRQLDNVWIKFDKAPFDASLDMPNQHAHVPVTITASNGLSAGGFIGWANNNINGGGDYNVSMVDGSTCSGTTVQGVDHHSTNYWHLNCGCQRHYLYSYSAGVGDQDASYKVNTGLGNWTATAGCSSTEGAGLALFAAVR
jgi:cysteine-rich repeat protein